MKYRVVKDPVKSLVEELGTQLSQKTHSDRVLSNTREKRFAIEPSAFKEIKPIDMPKKIAFVDGGDGPLDEAPNHMITINRVYYSLFQGKKRIKPKSSPRTQFFSYVTLNVSTANDTKKIKYDTKLFPYADEDKQFLPNESDLVSEDAGTSVMQGMKLNSLARRFTEWRLARHVVESELKEGDILVMDGSLQTNFKNEVTYAEKLYDLAIKKKVTICGLAKTSRLVTESGEPLLARIAEIAEKIQHQRWFINIAEKVSADDRGFMMVVKFHPKSQFVYRFEILREQFKTMTSEQINSILASLAENSQDVAMIGYPYGAIDADRFAQVRLDELNIYKGIMLSEKMKMPEWKRLQRYSASLTAHNVLNGVTS